MANKVAIPRNAFLYPMPVVLVGAVVDDTPNYMAVAWVTRVNYQPPLLGVALSARHHTARGIREHGEFGVSVPSRDLLVPTDYVGLVSGAVVDKSKVFETFTGELPHAPMARECALSMACRVVQTVELASNQFFIGEIVEAYCDDAALTHGAPDIEKLRPIGLTMPDNRYWGVGEYLGAAWSAGKAYRE
jgi:flavin reductase (DIM6/NTAB) family NADH-FMN oxidoreductase RutF